MSYIAFDLDALNVARDVGAAAGIPEERVTHGLLRMWAWCFREKSEHVTATHILGFFGTDACAALAAFGFLESGGSARWRVRGADRYLRVSEARSKGGQAARGNLIPGGPKRSASRDASRESRSAAAEPQPSPPLGSGSALTPSTEHRAPNTDHQAAAAGPASIDDFWRAAQDERTRVTGLARETPPHPRELSAWASEAMTEVDGDVGRLWAGYCAFLDDPFWRLDAKTKCAWRGWLGQWRGYVPPRAGAGPPPARPAKSSTRAPVAAESVDWSNVTPGEVQL